MGYSPEKRPIEHIKHTTVGKGDASISDSTTKRVHFSSIELEAVKNDLFDARKEKGDNIASPKLIQNIKISENISSPKLIIITLTLVICALTVLCATGSTLLTFATAATVMLLTVTTKSLKPSTAALQKLFSAVAPTLAITVNYPGREIFIARQTHSVEQKRQNSLGI